MQLTLANQTNSQTFNCEGFGSQVDFNGSEIAVLGLQFNHMAFLEKRFTVTSSFTRATTTWPALAVLAFLRPANRHP